MSEQIEETRSLGQDLIMLKLVNQDMQVHYPSLPSFAYV